MVEVRNLAVRPGGYEFNISGSPKEFKRALERIKEIPHGDGRIFDSEAKRWFVAERYREKLTSIFNNFEATLDAIESQEVLF
jgi:hypothetical protein